jgi:hypothetical protein
VFTLSRSRKRMDLLRTFPKVTVTVFVQTQCCPRVAYHRYLHALDVCHRNSTRPPTEYSTTYRSEKMIVHSLTHGPVRYCLYQRRTGHTVPAVITADYTCRLLPAATFARLYLTLGRTNTLFQVRPNESIPPGTHRPIRRNDPIRFI